MLEIIFVVKSQNSFIIKDGTIVSNVSFETLDNFDKDLMHVAFACFIYSISFEQSNDTTLSQSMHEKYFMQYMILMTCKPDEVIM